MGCDDLKRLLNRARRNNSYLEYLEILSFEKSTNLLTISCKVCGEVFKSDAERREVIQRV